MRALYMLVSSNVGGGVGVWGGPTAQLIIVFDSCCK